MVHVVNIFKIHLMRKNPDEQSGFFVLPSAADPIAQKTAQFHEPSNAHMHHNASINTSAVEGQDP